MVETHKTSQWKRVLSWFRDNPDCELTQSNTNQWRPPVYRLGAVIWTLRHRHGIDIVKRVEKKRAYYRLAPSTTHHVTQGSLPFAGSLSNKKAIEDTKDLAALLVQVSEQLVSLSVALETLGRETAGGD